MSDKMDLGNGLYASFDGTRIWLADEHLKVLALDEEQIAKLFGFLFTLGHHQLPPADTPTGLYVKEEGVSLGYITRDEAGRERSLITHDEAGKVRRIYVEPEDHEARAAAVKRDPQVRLPQAHAPCDEGSSSFPIYHEAPTSSTKFHQSPDKAVNVLPWAESEPPSYWRHSSNCVCEWCKFERDSTPEVARKDFESRMYPWEPKEPKE